MKKTLSFWFAVFLFAQFFVLVEHTNAQVELKEETVSMPTYKVLKPEKAPIFFTNENYQGASRYTYPLA